MKLVGRHIEYLRCCLICWNRQPLSSRSRMFREKSNCRSIVRYHDTTHAVPTENNDIIISYQFITILPKVNSSVDRPDAERAATKADGPGIGITGIFSSTHSFAYMKGWNWYFVTTFYAKFDNRCTVYILSIMMRADHLLKIYSHHGPYYPLNIFQQIQLLALNIYQDSFYWNKYINEKEQNLLKVNANTTWGAYMFYNIKNTIRITKTK